MPSQTTLHIDQETLNAGEHAITLTLEQPGQPRLAAKARIQFALTPQEHEDLRWYMEDSLGCVEAVEREQIEQWMRRRGEELYTKVLAANLDTQALWFAVRQRLADLRIEIASGVAEAASIPWELMRDPQSDSAIALRAQSFVRVQSNPNSSFVPVPSVDGGRVRLLYIVCRPAGRNDVELRAVANRLVQDLGEDRARFDITALRPPTFERLQQELSRAKAANRPYQIVHFDGHGVYEDLRNTPFAQWSQAIHAPTPDGSPHLKHGYLLFEHPDSARKTRPVSGAELGQVLHDNGVPVLVLNACQSAMHEASGEGKARDGGGSVHDEVRAIGSLAQGVIDHGIPAVLGMRYSVFVVTAAQYIGQLYAALAQGRAFGEAASDGRKHLARNPERWIGLEPRPLQDWFVPVAFEAAPIRLLPPKAEETDLHFAPRPDLDPVQHDRLLRRYVPDTGFVGRDETLLLLDRAFDEHAVVLLHAYAGQGKSATAVEFARWYAQTGGLGPKPNVLFSSFQNHRDLTDLLNQVGQAFAPIIEASGVEWHALDDAAARRQLVLEILRKLPVLWIWDNVEPVAGFPAGTESAWTVEEQADLADFLKQIKLDRATKARVLLTSRRDEGGWLGGIPCRIAMPRMRNSDAAGLARSLGGERSIGREETAEWQPLLDYCQGNPLTLRVLVGQAMRLGLRGRGAIESFIEAIRNGEQGIEDVNEREGRDKSLGASLDYGFRQAFQEDEQAIVSLLHLFQGTVDAQALAAMGKAEHALPELEGNSKAHLTGLLDRARETGLLSQLGGTRFSIHPALPWFLRQLFARHYDGIEGRSSAADALRAWAEAVGGLGDFYAAQFAGGNRRVTEFLALEEANLLHARRTARRQGWWNVVTSVMQGLRTSFEYQGRLAEWARLVAEITPDYCADDDSPLPGQEEGYSLVLEYRVGLATDYDRDLPRAAALEEKRVASSRQRAATALALPADAPLDSVQRNRIRTLGVSVQSLGNILREQANADCVPCFEQSITHARRIQDIATEAVAHYNLGRAFIEIPALRNLDAAEAAYQASLALRDPGDALGRSNCLQQIGMVHHERFKESRRRGEPADVVLKHAQAAEKHYRQALDLCPPSALTHLGPIHNGIGALCAEAGQVEPARVHYEKAAQSFERTGDRYRAGQTRFNIALMFAQAANREPLASRQQNLVERAQAYAQAALHDFQHYQGRADDMESKTRQFLDRIHQALDPKS